MGNVLGRRRQKEWSPERDGQSPDKKSNKSSKSNGSHHSKVSHVIKETHFNQIAFSVTTSQPSSS